MAFVPDYPGAIVFPAHPTNYYLPENHSGVKNQPKGWVLHTPEEPADDNESTPAFFSAPNRQASTHYYLDNDGDVYQMVPEECAALANGVVGKPYPSWANPNSSLNWQSINVEIEGFGASIQNTMPVDGPQFSSLVRLIKHRAKAYGFLTDREHIIGHYQVSNQRTDPGALFPWEALIEALKEEEPVVQPMMIRHNAVGAFWNGQTILQATEFRPSQEMNARLDLNLPISAKAVRLEIATRRGRVQVFDGDSKFAGQVGIGLVNHMYLDVFLDERGFCLIGGHDGAITDFIGCVGYWE